MSDTVKFDPGIGELFVNFNDFIDPIYTKLKSMPTLVQKRITFKMAEQKIVKAMRNNVAFYAGCMMWAYYISNMQEEKQLEGNAFLDMPEDIRKNYDYLIPLNFIDAYFEAFEKDTGYYVGRKSTIPQKWKNIVAVYRKFLKLNDGFLNTKTNKDVQLPDEVKNYNFNFDIPTRIEQAIQKRNLDILLENIEL